MRMFFKAVLISIMVLPLFSSAQNQTVSGKVTDAAGNAVSNASVVINKSNQGTITNATGEFSLSVPANATITISFAGYKSQILNIADVTGPIAIKLEQDVANLDEVVVTGLTTTVKRKNLANAVATISSKQLTGTAPAQTLDGALEGKIPGAYINANSGAPGGGITVKLRGVTSVYGNTQPLYVVDGVFIDNSSTSAGLNAVTAAAAAGNAANQDNPSSRIADIRPEDI